MTEQTAGSTTSGKNKLIAELFLLSLLSLYVELFIIRWMSCDFLAFSVFTTFPLVTCFAGLGLGYAKKSTALFKAAPWALLQFVITIQLLQFISFSNWIFPSTETFDFTNVTLLGDNLWLYVLTFICLLVILLMGPFAVEASIGARLGQLFDEFEPLKAYCVNIAGSIAGSILFSITAFLGLTPWQTMLPACLLLLFYLPRGKWQPWLNAAALSICIAGTAIGKVDPKLTVYWTPYQRLDVYHVVQEPPELKESQGLSIGGNGRFYQYALNLSEENLANKNLKKEFKDWLSGHARNYNLPYKLTAPKTVLILGAGSGNDVAAALRHGAEHVDAVDIDPQILKLGKIHHPERPYDSPRVTAYCNDARDFLKKCKSKYDLVIFAGLDSHAVTGRGASMRLDNYVYTRESIEDAHKLLNPKGLMYLSFCKSRDWLSQRLFSTIEAATGSKPVVVLDSTVPELQWEIFLAGPLTREPGFDIPESAAPFKIERLESPPKNRILTDDWPFIYVNPIKFDAAYFSVLLTVLMLCLFASRKFLFAPAHPSMWQMFFLGAGFFLLELQAIARLALLYGSTWMTTSVVINGILVLILIANYIVIRAGAKIRPAAAYGGLLLALMASYFLPVQPLLAMDVAGRAIITFITLVPMFAAAIIFGTAFKSQQDPGKALAFNLLGAVIGAMLEYLSNYTGISTLVLVALGLYAFSFACQRMAPDACAGAGAGGD